MYEQGSDSESEVQRHSFKLSVSICQLNVVKRMTCVCFPSTGLSFGFTSVGGSSFADLANSSLKFVFGKIGECCLYLFTSVSHFTCPIH